MKKFVLIIAVIMLFAAFPAQALSLTEYGAPLLTDSFEKGEIDGFPYSKTESAAVICTTDEAHKGKTSVLMDWSALAEGDTVKFVRSFYGYGVNPTKENYGAEFYVKGENLDKRDITFVYTYYNQEGQRNGAYTDLKKEDAGNGWIKVSAILPLASDFNLNQSGNIGVLFTKKSGKTDCVYIDDISVYSIPEKINFKNRSIPNSGRFNLDEIAADAYNPHGTAEDLVNSWFTKWQVVSGNAEIDGRTLVYESSEKKIVLKGEFFGCTDTVTLYVSDNVKEISSKADLTAGEITENSGVYSVTVTNNGAAAGRASIIAAVYENGRLCDITVSYASVNPGVSVTLSTEKVTGTDVKVSVWDSIFGCISIKN